MPPPETILDFAKLLVPIPGEKPTGANLRADPSLTPLYYAIKDARNAASTAERHLAMGKDEKDVKPPDWRPVYQHATQALEEKTKDLEVAAYLIEALLRLHHFAGLRDGFRLARELADRFWDDLYPLPDEEGLSTRVKALADLNGEDDKGTLIIPIARVPITRPKSVRAVAAINYQPALELEKVTDAKLQEKKIAQGTVPLAAFRLAVAESPPEFFTDLVRDLTECCEEFDRLCATLQQKCDGRAPPSSFIKSELESCLAVVKEVAREKLAPPPVKAKIDGNGSDTPPPEPDGPIADREDAFRRLKEVADYFRRTEPHTVVSYALDQVVRWGRMSLPELLAELIPDEGPRKSLFKQVGMKLPEPPPPPAPAKR